MTAEFAVGVHALVYLNHKAQTLSSEALAENVCTNPARIRKVMAKLKKAGLVETREGADGGYRFQKDPARVSLRMVLEAVDTTVVSAGWKPGNKEMECLVASGMADLMDGVYAELDALCRRRLETITIQDVDRKIFSNRNIEQDDAGTGWESNSSSR